MKTLPSLSCPDCRIALTTDLYPKCDRCGYALHFERGVYRNNAMSPPEGFSSETRKHLSTIEERHFWFGPRDRLLRLLARRELPPASVALELGGGSGRFLSSWDGLFSSVTMVEAHIDSLEEAAGRGSRTILLQADICSLPLSDGQFDALTAFDVLEHADAGRMLGEARRVARSGARFLLAVPACRSLWSYADELAGHRCRYDIDKIESELRDRNWRLIGHTHYQCALFPLLWFSRRILRRQGRSMERNPSRMVGAILGAINKVEVALFSGVPLPFGSSLIVWAEAI